MGSALDDYLRLRLEQRCGGCQNGHLRLRTWVCYRHGYVGAEELTAHFACDSCGVQITQVYHDWHWPAEIEREGSAGDGG